MKIVLAKILLFSRKVSGEYQISSSESQNGLISKPKFSAFLTFARKSRKEKFGHFPSIEQLFFFSLEDTVKVISRLVELI